MEILRSLALPQNDRKNAQNDKKEGQNDKIVKNIIFYQQLQYLKNYFKTNLTGRIALHATGLPSLLAG